MSSLDYWMKKCTKAEDDRDQLKEDIKNLKSLIVFLAETWSEIDDFIYKNCDGETLCKYPVIQGTKNQLNLRTIGGLGGHNNNKIQCGIQYVLNHNNSED